MGTCSVAGVRWLATCAVALWACGGRAVGTTSPLDVRSSEAAHGQAVDGSSLDDATIADDAIDDFGTEGNDGAAEAGDAAFVDAASVVGDESPSVRPAPLSVRAPLAARCRLGEPPEAVRTMAFGSNSLCLLEDGRVRCSDPTDGEGAMPGYVDTGGRVRTFFNNAGYGGPCVIRDDHRVRCWGSQLYLVPGEVYLDHRYVPAYEPTIEGVLPAWGVAVHNGDDIAGCFADAEAADSIYCYGHIWGGPITGRFPERMRFPFEVRDLSMANVDNISLGRGGCVASQRNEIFCWTQFEPSASADGYLVPIDLRRIELPGAVREFSGNGWGGCGRIGEELWCWGVSVMGLRRTDPRPFRLPQFSPSSFANFSDSSICSLSIDGRRLECLSLMVENLLYQETVVLRDPRYVRVLQPPASVCEIITTGSGGIVCVRSEAGVHCARVQDVDYYRGGSLHGWGYIDLALDREFRRVDSGW